MSNIRETTKARAALLPLDLPCQAMRLALQEEIDRLQNQLEVERQNQFGQLQCDLDRLREHYRQLEVERQRLQSDLAEVFSSSTLRLRNRVVGLPLVGTWLKSFARIAAGRSS